MRGFLAAVLFSVAVIPCANAHSENRSAPRTPGATPAAASEPATGTGPVAARFEASIRLNGKRAPEKTDWYFLRQTNRIEALRPGGGIAEIWLRDERGDLSLKRIFHPDRRVVEYFTGDLRAMGVADSWAKLGSIIDPASLGQQLKRVGTTKDSHGETTRYKGSHGGQSIEVWWLERASLPAKIVRESDDGRFTLTLKALHAAPPPSWPRTDEAAIASYLVIDAADLGDRHGDPFVSKVERFDAETRAFGRSDLGHSH